MQMKKNKNHCVSWTKSLTSFQRNPSDNSLAIQICLWFSDSVTQKETAKSLQSCPTLGDPIDGSPPDSPIPGILQARTLELVAISFFNAWKWKVNVKSLSHARLLESQCTAAYQAPPSTGFSRQEYWSGVPLPSPEERFIGRNNANEKE